MKNDDITIGQISDAKNLLKEEIKKSLIEYKLAIGEYPSNIEISFDCFVTIGEEVRQKRNPKISIFQEV